MFFINVAERHEFIFIGSTPESNENLVVLKLCSFLEIEI